jgi:hypothetical protein
MKQLLQIIFNETFLADPALFRAERDTMDSPERPLFPLGRLGGVSHVGRRGRSGESIHPDSLTFAGRAISRGADGAWYVAGDPEGLGYATLEDAEIAAQFMGRAA